ncbi:MAG: hypothetical protein ABSG86_07585 [Thermoguttaceae bacterium]
MAIIEASASRCASRSVRLMRVTFFNVRLQVLKKPSFSHLQR